MPGFLTRAVSSTQRAAWPASSVDGGCGCSVATPVFDALAELYSDNMSPGLDSLKPPRTQPINRKLVGELSKAEFLRGVLEGVRARLGAELQGLSARQQWSLIKLFDEEPSIHFELWLHANRSTAELGLHFETRNAERNQQLLEFVADDLPFLKEVIGQGLEAEPWDKGWTRLYISQRLDRLNRDEQDRLAAAFARFIETLDPIRREAAKACPSSQSRSELRE
jgi:hypothetical protein